MVLSLLVRLIPWSTVALVVAGVVLVQLLGLDLLGMAGGLIADWLGVSWDTLLSW